MSIQLVWFKRDLRVADHEPLTNAVATNGQCLCLYVYEPELLMAADFDRAHLHFINQSLVNLREHMRTIGGELTIRTGRMPDVLEQLHERLGIATIWSHEETHNQISYRRDQRVRAWAKSMGVAFVEVPQHGVIRRLTNRDGWAAKWQKRMKSPVLPVPNRIQSPHGIACGDVRDCFDFRIHAFDRNRVQPGGERQAGETLNSFLTHRGVNYRNEMSSPVTAAESCSRLSPYLAYGNVSMRTVYQAAKERSDQLKALRNTGQVIEPTWLQSLSSFQGRLRWHCHFIQKLEDEPAIEFENINRAYDGLREHDFDRRKFDAWCCGQTGYPMVDACIRALQQTGWINFRMRAMLVSFACHHLWLHWREPALYLARLFLDYEPGIHYSQMQMQAGVTGINTVRIYSPIKQVTDQDPTGQFIRRYVSELRHVPDRFLAEPNKMSTGQQTAAGCRIGRDYPPPIVDHQTQYRAARERIHQVKRSKAAREKAAAVYQKHGSRRRR